MTILVKFIIGLIDICMVYLLGLSLYIYFTPSGLHYLVVIYGAIGVLILNSIRLLLMIKNGRRSLINYFSYWTIPFMTFSALFSIDNAIIGIVLSSFGCLLVVFVGYDFWIPNILGHALIDSTIKYFSVDFEAKGWSEKQK